MVTEFFTEIFDNEVFGAAVANIIISFQPTSTVAQCAKQYITALTLAQHQELLVICDQNRKQNLIAILCSLLSTAILLVKNHIFPNFLIIKTKTLSYILSKNISFQICYFQNSCFLRK